MKVSSCRMRIRYNEAQLYVQLLLNKRLHMPHELAENKAESSHADGELEERFLNKKNP